MKMKTLVAALSGAFLIGAATLAPAQKVPSEPAKAVTPDKMENKTSGITNDQYQAEKDKIEAEAKAGKKACDALKDNAKDICQAEYKGKEKLAKKELDLKKNPNDKNAQDVEKMKAEVAYEIQKEKCEDMKGADMAKCKKDAKATKDSGMAAAKGKKMADAGSTSAPAPSSAPAPRATTPSGTAPSAAPGTPASPAGALPKDGEKKSPGK